MFKYSAHAQVLSITSEIPLHSNFKQLSSETEYMTINGTTMKNLEILQNQVRTNVIFLKQMLRFSQLFDILFPMKFIRFANLTCMS